MMNRDVKLADKHKLILYQDCNDVLVCCFYSCYTDESRLIGVSNVDLIFFFKCLLPIQCIDGFRANEKKDQWG